MYRDLFQTFHKKQHRSEKRCKICLEQPRVLEQRTTESFQYFKERISRSKGDVELVTDASGNRIGGVLLQKDSNNEIHPVAYISR